MDLSTFFKKFDQFADASYAVAKLRELVLELAASGRLMPEALERPVEEDTKLMGPLVELVMGQAPAGSECNTEGRGTVFVKVGEFGPLYPREEVWTTDPLKFAKKGDVLVCVVGATVGKLNLAIDCAIGRSVAAIRPSSALDTKFLYYSLIPYTLHLRRNSRGSAQGVIGKAELNAVSLWVPRREVQKRIVAKVDELMALCDRLEAQQQERESRARGLARAALARFAAAPTVSNLKYLFDESFPIAPADLRKSILTFAVQGKLAPQDPKDNRVHGFGTPLKETEVPWPLPLSWSWIRLGNIANIKHGYAFSSDSFTLEPTRYVLTTPGNFYESGGFRDRRANTKYFDGVVPSAFVFKAGDLIIPMTEQAAGLLGSPAFIPDDGKTYLHNQRLGKLEFLAKEISPAFAFWFFNTDFFRGELAKTCTGMKVRHTSPKRVLVVPFPLPPLAEQRRIVAKVEQLMALVDALEQQLAASRATVEKLLTALVAEITSSHPPKPRVFMAAEDPGHYDVAVKVPDLSSSLEFTRTVLAAEIVHRMHGDRTFGQIKFQKALYLTENIFQLNQIDSHPERYQNGPHDPELIAQVETKMKECEWFEAALRTGGHGHEYHALPKAGGHQDHFEKIWPKQAAAIRKLIDEMKTWKTERCERFATLYAAWNDLIHWKQPADDAAILDQVLNHWHSAKQQIPKSKWQEMLAWMKREGYVPTGWGQPTSAAPQSELF